MSLLFNMMSRLVITFLPRSKCLLISQLQSPSAVILEPIEQVWPSIEQVLNKTKQNKKRAQLKILSGSPLPTRTSQTGAGNVYPKGWNPNFLVNIKKPSTFSSQPIIIVFPKSSGSESQFCVLLAKMSWAKCL